MDYKYRYSIIIGTYNHENTIGKLAEALNQLESQGFETLLCDDSSTDKTREAFEKAINPLIKKGYRYFRQENKGMRLAKNVNQGIKEAQGEQKEIAFWVVRCELGAGGNWFAWCRNDYTTH